MNMKKEPRIIVGFDGFIDTLLQCVDKRIGTTKYLRIPTLSRLASRIKQAAKKNANIECVIQEESLGGNAPLLGQTLTSLGNHIDLIGCCGFPELHPLFSPIRNMGGTVHSFANPGLTDALEFNDGKIFLGKMRELGTLSLSTFFSRFSEKQLSSLIKETTLIATVNWTMMPLVQELWAWLLDHTHLLKEKYLFVDLADPAKRSKSDLKRGLTTLQKLASHCSIILGTNLSESQQLCKSLHLSPSELLEENAQLLANALSLHTVSIHTSKEVVGFHRTENELCNIKVPHCKQPYRSTGAGDNFNAGFLSAFLKTGSLEKALQSGIATSGIWIRTGTPATQEMVRLFLRTWKLDPTSLNVLFSPPK